MRGRERRNKSMPERLRLLYLLGSRYPAGAADIVALARFFVRHGHAAVLAGPLTRVQQEQVTLGGMRWVNLSFGPYSDTTARTTTARQVRKLLTGQQFDIMHCFGLAATAAGLQAVHRLRPRPRVIGTLSDLSVQKLAGWEAWHTRWRLRQAAALILSADSELQALKGLDARLAARSHLIQERGELRPITSDFDLARKRLSLGVRAESAVIGVISPAVSQLGLSEVLQAAVLITRDFPNVEFLIIGDGPDQSDLILQAHNLGIGGAVVFRGDRADIAEIIASLNILLIPREVPGSLTYALQALAHEIPVVATRTPALVEILEKVDPQAFVAMDDPATIAAAIAQRLEILPPPEEELYQELGLSLSYKDMVVSKAEFDLDQVGLEAQYRGDESEMQRAVRQAEERYSPRTMADEIAALYQQVLQR